ncbi:VOC family protein [uncultured Abyssibacter sp.]|uniref:VOC family protein n=1 Tax=uncultured Abyssibacter sp. TaxID=2320202 RepID=UPI0032B1CE29|tara:strand:+ start:185 stop:556 length:372 start_codon:yes stop_codon:yes gene_type:complete
MALGAFSVSLAVSDIQASQAFYAKLGFEPVGGDVDHHWLILRNGDTTIGLFQGMFESNVLTFNPGWDAQCNPLEHFEDVRAIQSRLKAAGVVLSSEADPDSTGPAHIALTDPDGNAILIDQHV